MNFQDIKGIRFYSFANCFKSAEITHFVTSRRGGVSTGAYSALNIGYGTDDYSLAVLENRLRMSEAIDIPIDYFVMCNQVHGTHVEVVTKSHRGMGALNKNNSLLATDAMVTNIPEICLFVQGADCVPLLFFDPVKKVIGAAHAGWRGTLKNIASETVKKMGTVFGTNPAHLQVGIGPSIGPCCYKVGGDVIDEVLRVFGSTDNFIVMDGNSPVVRLDLWYTNKYQLIEAGVLLENIDISGICTHCHSDEFFSSRAGKGDTGRFGAGIMLNL